jgi:uncharacterized phage protein (TIGR02220 family)
MNGYSLSEKWFDFMAKNSNKVELKHTAFYMYLVEMFNKREWVDVIGLPTDYTMSVLNIGSYKTYKGILNDLESFGFIILVSKATNDHTSNKVALVKNAKVDTKESLKYIPKKVQSSDQSSAIEGSPYINIQTLKQETLKLINDNATLVDDNLKNWIKDFKTEKEIIHYDRIFNYFKEITGKKIKIFGDKEKAQLKARLKDGFAYEDIELAIKNCFNDEWHKDKKYKYLTLEFILRQDKLSKFSTAIESTNPTQNPTDKQLWVKVRLSNTIQDFIKSNYEQALRENKLNCANPEIIKEYYR